MNARYLVTRSGALSTLPIGNEWKSQYVPHAVQLPNGDMWLVAKGDDTKSIHAYKSTDCGKTYLYMGILVAPSGGTNWDGGICLDPVLAYPGGDTLHLLWKGNPNPTAGYGGWAIGHGTMPVSNPMLLTRDALNPILTSAQVQTYYATLLGVTTVGDLFVSDVHRDPWNVLTYWCGLRDQNSRYLVFRCRGDWSSFTPRNEGTLLPTTPNTFVQAPCVIQHPDFPVSVDALGNGVGKYLMIYTEGQDSGAAGALHQATATCAADGNWIWTRSGQTFLAPGIAGTWDSKVAYAAHLAKAPTTKMDTPLNVLGSYQLYYSGVSLTDASHAHFGCAKLTPIAESISLW